MSGLQLSGNYFHKRIKEDEDRRKLFSLGLRAFVITRSFPISGFKNPPAVIPEQSATLAEDLWSPPLFTHTDGKDGIMVGLSDNGSATEH